MDLVEEVPSQPIILIIQDHFSKSINIIPLSDSKVDKVAKALNDNYKNADQVQRSIQSDKIHEEK